MGQGTTTQTTGPLTNSTKNPRYFVDKNGTSVYLVGTQTWNTFQDIGNNGGITTFDFNAYVAFLKAHHHNATILWHKDLPQACNWSAGGQWRTSDVGWPWIRSTTPGATDGGNKFDLATLNQPFFDRMLTRAQQLNNAGIYVVVQFFDGLGLADYRCSGSSPNGDGLPFSSANNINGVSDGGGQGMMTQAPPNGMTPFQTSYIDKVIDTIGFLPNVIWELSEEAPTNSTAWQTYMISHIQTYEAGKPLQHPILYATLSTSGASDSTLYNSNANAAAPKAQLPAAGSNCGTGTPVCKVVLNDSDHNYFGMWNDSAQTNRLYVWRNFTNAENGGIFFMDPYTIFAGASSTWTNRNNCDNNVAPPFGTCTNPDTRWNNFRDNMGATNLYANSKIRSLVDMTPQPSLSSTGFCLANNIAIGAQFVIFQPNNGSFTVNLSTQTGRTLNVEWYNASTNTYVTAATVNGGSASQSFQAPFSSDSVLFLNDPITPKVFFTDLTSGPNTGGENNNGTILTIYGKNFGQAQGNSTVTVGGQPVAAYLRWGGRSKAGSRVAQLETISVAIGSAAVSGTVSVVTVNGTSTCENTKDNCQFTVRAGNIKCVSTTGNDSNNGSFPSSCFATIPKGKTASAGGDITYVLDGVTASVQENFNAALAIINNTCTLSNPCSLLGYPGAKATIGADSLTFGIRNPAVAGQMSFWSIANFFVKGQTGFEPQKVDNYRIVDNDFSCPQGGGQSACVHTVQATNYFFYGNYTHNVGDQHGSIDKFYHGNYYTTDTNHVWAGWNEVDNNPTGSTTSGGCRGIQFFSTAGSNQFDLHIFNSYIHNVICDGINFSTVNPANGTVEAYNNVVFHVGTGPDPANGGSNYSCIVAGSGGTGTGAVLAYNNTLEDCGGRKVPDAGAFDPTVPNITSTNNITYQLTGESYINPNGNANLLSGSNNIWFGLASPPSQTTGNITSDPLFAVLGSDFTIPSNSPAKGAGTAVGAATWDFNGLFRPSPPSIGAFEFSTGTQTAPAPPTGLTITVH